MMRNINKIIALGLLLFLFSGIYFFSVNYDPLQTEIEDDEQLPNNSNREFEEMFGITSDEIIESPIDVHVEYRLETIELEDGWGYNIYANQQMVINQIRIPGITAVVSFLNREQAEKAGKLVIQKIRNGIYPPNISKSELDSLGVDY
jgi:hypothetical protein